MSILTPADVSAVVCTLNSEIGIERCLISLKESGVGQIVVVDAQSTDNTLRLVQPLADLLLQDSGQGLGSARNIGIASTQGALVLNMGSDNVLPRGELLKMISYLEEGDYQGVSARTVVLGSNYVSLGLNVWRDGRFKTGERAVIGTPTLFYGKMLREHPYDSTRRFSDDSELCERWAKSFGAKFAISDAICLENGKSNWKEVRIRAKMYGVSDSETYTQGVRAGWNLNRKLTSLLYPVTADVLTPLRQSHPKRSLLALPLLMGFTFYRYLGWGKEYLRQRKNDGIVRK